MSGELDFVLGKGLATDTNAASLKIKAGSTVPGTSYTVRVTASDSVSFAFRDILIFFFFVRCWWCKNINSAIVNVVVNALLMFLMMLLLISLLMSLCSY